MPPRPPSPRLPNSHPTLLPAWGPASQPRLWPGWLAPFICHPWFCASSQDSCSPTLGFTEAGRLEGPLALVLGNEGRRCLEYSLHPLPSPPIESGL